MFFDTTEMFINKKLATIEDLVNFKKKKCLVDGTTKICFLK